MSLNNDNFENSHMLGLLPAAIDYVEQRRNGNPSRRPNNSNTVNVTGTFYSDKTDLAIDTDSRGPEKGFAILCEFDDEILEFYEQPEPVKIEIINKLGTTQSVWYTPDYLVLGKFRPRVYEIKTIATAEELCLTKPNDWIKDEDGTFRYLPAEKAFNELGLDFSVFVYKTSDRFRIENYYLLLHAREKYQSNEYYSLKAMKLLKKKFCVSITELMEELNLTATTPILQMIDEGYIRADLSRALLANPDGCLVAQNQYLLEYGRDLWESQKIYSGEVIQSKSLNEIPPQKYAENAIKNLEHYNKGVKDRQYRRIVEKIKVNKTETNSIFQCLIPNWDKSGNYGTKMPEKTRSFLLHYLTEIHGKLQGVSIKKSFLKYRGLARIEHPFVDPAGEKTFRKYRKQLETIEALQRGGKRALNAVKGATDPRERNIQAMIPWQAAAIDHYEASIYLVFFAHDGSVWVAKPTVTVLIDIASKEILSYSISFLKPSRKSIAKCLRDCVRRHGRLPMEITSDHGSDFMSVYMASFLAHYGIGHSLRPVAYPQFGSEIEGCFGEFEQGFLCMLPGNTVNAAEARSADGNKAPKNSAILTIEQFKSELEHFIHWRSSKIIGDATESTALKFNRGVRLFPFMGKQVSYNTEFLMMSAIDVRPFKVHSAKGIHIDERWYYSPELRSLLGRTNKVSVRIDPENPYVVYALVDKKWVPCWNNGINTFETFSPETQYAQGIIKLEGRALRSKARDIQDEEFIATLNQLPTDIAVKPMLVPISVPSTEDLSESAFDFGSVQPLEAVSWGEAS